jgi:hypothetical protein
MLAAEVFIHGVGGVQDVVGGARGEGRLHYGWHRPAWRVRVLLPHRGTRPGQGNNLLFGYGVSRLL